MEVWRCDCGQRVRVIHTADLPGAVVIEPSDAASRWRYRDLVWEHMHPHPVGYVPTRRGSR